jgi:hypothetical protein
VFGYDLGLFPFSGIRLTPAAGQRDYRTRRKKKEECPTSNVEPRTGTGVDAGRFRGAEVSISGFTPAPFKCSRLST